MKKILITGATGYIGTNVIKRLVKEVPDCKIVTLNRTPEKAGKILPFAQCEHRMATDFPQADLFVPDVILHLATFSTASNNSEIIDSMLNANIKYGIQLLQYASNLKNPKLTFINTGSFAEYRDGYENGLRAAYLYTATKSAFRHILEFYSAQSHLKYINAIPYSVYGPNDTRKKIMDYLFESLNSDEPIAMTKGEQVLDFIHIDDVSQFFVEAIKVSELLPHKAEYHIGTSIGTSIREVAQKIEHLTNSKLNADWGKLPYRPLDTMYAVAPKALMPPFWEPKITLEEGLKELLEKRIGRK